MDLLTIAAEFDLVPVEVQMEARLGTDAYGRPVLGPPVTVKTIVDQTRKLVRSPQGEQVVSETTLLAPLDTTCPDGSRVTLPDGQVTTVITTSAHRGHGNPDVPECLEIACE